MPEATCSPAPLLLLQLELDVLDEADEGAEGADDEDDFEAQMRALEEGL
jgi:hypothetical protein